MTSGNQVRSLSFTAFQNPFADPAGPPYEVADFTDYFGVNHLGWIVQHNGGNYYVKRCRGLVEAQKDLLAYNLIAPLMNVPSIIMPDALTRAKLDLALKARQPDTQFEALTLHLVRLCQDYQTPMLPITDLTQAVAAEIVFSTWINRRDAHNCNRVYVSGIPMFFDFAAAFEASEPGTPTDFFRSGSNSGFVPNWRLWKIPEDKRIVTHEIRNLERGRPITLHPVHDEILFWQHVDFYRDVVIALPESHIQDVVDASISDEPKAKTMTDCLCTERRRLWEKLDFARTFMTAQTTAKPE
jgi:hypothetical protein